MINSEATPDLDEMESRLDALLASREDRVLALQYFGQQAQLARFRGDRRPLPEILDELEAGYEALSAAPDDSLVN